MQAEWERRLLDLAGKLPPKRSRPLESYWAEDEKLQSAYKAASRIAALNSKSFYLASSLLPEEKRLAVRALYAFCRTVDDIVDEQDNPGRNVQLDYWRRIVRTRRASSKDLIASAWVDAMTRYHIPAHYAQQLIDGVARDLTKDRYQSFDELSMYCYGVASTVGLMSMFIIGFRTNEAVPYAIRLGVALQMTNILRDVGEDYRSGRIYLPQDELAHFSIRESDIAAGQVTKNWRRFMRFQIKRARKLYQEAWPGVSMLKPEGRLAIAAAADFYGAILDEIEANEYNVFTHRAHLGAWQKLSRVPQLWWKLKVDKSSGYNGKRS